MALCAAAAVLAGACAGGGPVLAPPKENPYYARQRSTLVVARMEEVKQQARAQSQAIRELPAPGESGRVYALLVGIGKYEDSRIPPLRYAVSDAWAVEQALLKSGVPQENILVLTNEGARLQDIRSAISDHLGRALEEDTAVLYFSCHGSAAAETLSAREYADGFEKFLLTYNADPAKPAGSALSMSDLKSDIDKLPSCRIAVLVDACYAGSATQLAGAKSFAPPSGTGYKAVNLVDDYYGGKFVPDAERAAARGKARAVVVFAGSQANQVSRESDEWGGSLFTHHLAAGLAGDADADGDGRVAMNELYRHVRDEVARASSSKQTPVLFPEDIPFPINLTPRR